MLIDSRTSKGPLAFLGLFALISGILLLLWGYFSEYYLAAVLPVANKWFALRALPIKFEQHQDLLLLVFRELNGHLHHLKVTEYIQFSVVAAVGVFAATPGVSTEWRIRWVVRVVLLCWAMHVFSFCLSGYIGIWNYLNGLPVAEKRELMARGWSAFPRDQGGFIRPLFELWNMWGSAALILLIWFWASPSRLFDRNGKRVKREKTGGGISGYANTGGKVPA